MDDIELHYLELTQVAHLLQTRKISPVELTQAMLKRIESLGCWKKPLGSSASAKRSAGDAARLTRAR